MGESRESGEAPPRREEDGERREVQGWTVGTGPIGVLPDRKPGGEAVPSLKDRIRKLSSEHPPAIGGPGRGEAQARPSSLPQDAPDPDTAPTRTAQAAPPAQAGPQPLKLEATPVSPQEQQRIRALAAEARTAGKPAPSEDGPSPTPPTRIDAPSRPAQAPAPATSQAKSAPGEPPSMAPWLLILQPVLAGRGPLALKVTRPLVVGRADVEANIRPDVDLTGWGGSGQGVSRQHAILMPSPEGLWLIDLDSTNGTWVNGLYLQPGTKYRLRSGDQVEFGSLRTLVRVLANPAAPIGEETDSREATLVSRSKPRR